MTDSEEPSNEKIRKWLSRGEQQALVVGAGVTGSLSAIAQFLASYVHSGLMLLLYSTAILVAGVTIFIAAVRGWNARKKTLAVRVNVVIMVSLILIVLGGVGGVLGRGLGIWARPSPTTACDYKLGDVGVVPVKGGPAAPDGLTICPALLNNGSPLTGAFNIAGRFIGDAADYQSIVVVGRGEPGHCDVYGNPPDSGYYYQSSFRIDVDGRWSFHDGVGYTESVTLTRDYQFITGPPEALATIRSDRSRYDEAHDGDNGYTGIQALPIDARVLATVHQPAGTYNGKGPAPCKKK